MIKAIIFDLDGTLLNTLGDIHAVLNESLQKFSLPTVTLEETKAFVGNGARALVERAVKNAPSELADKVYFYYAKRFSETDNDLTSLYDGEEQTLLKLKKKGIRFAVVTNKPQRAAENVCAKYLSKFGFSEVLGQTEYYPLKPNPASTLAVMGRLNVKKDECVFVGDGETDIQTAEAAGIRCLSALWGYRSERRLLAAGATCLLREFKEIAEHV